MEEAKAELEKKVSVLLEFIQNRKKIPNVTKKELVRIVYDLQEHCHLLLQQGTNASSNSDSEYYSSEEPEISVGNVTETLSLDYAAMLRKLQETELRNEDFVKQVSNLKQETDYLRDQNIELAGDIGGKRSEDRDHFKGLMSKGEATLLHKQNKELEMELEKKTIQVKRLEEETDERAKTELRILEEKDALGNKVQELEMSFDKQRKELSEENQKLRTRISEKEREMKNLTNLLERKMEELAEDFRMKTEDHIQILDKRIHAAEQIHLESKNNYNKGDQSVSETEFKKIKEMVEQGLSGPEKAIKKLEEGEEMVKRVTILAKEVDSARKWVKEKKSETKHEVETLEAKLECREAQESLVKEKLSKLEAKLAEEGTEKMSLDKAMRRIKKLEIEAKEKEFELLSLCEGKREAIRQLCVLMDYQRCRYNDLKTSIVKVALQA